MQDVVLGDEFEPLHECTEESLLRSIDINKITAKEIAAFVGGIVFGDENKVVRGVSPVDLAGEGDLTFIAQEKYDKFLETSPAHVFLVRKNAPQNKEITTIEVANPYLAFVRVAVEVFSVGKTMQTGIHPTAVVHSDAVLGKNVSIGAFTTIHQNAVIGEDAIIAENVVVGRKAEVGKNCHIFNNVTIGHHVKIGNDVIIQAGSVIGSDGFGYVKDGDRSYKIPHVGSVVLEDRVEIGANCAIDRATFGLTTLKAGVKLDNLIHVAHNVQIGENTVIAAQSGISGSTQIGENVVIAGQVGFVGHITIGDRAVFGAQAGVTKSIPPNLVVSGYPAKDHKKAKREEAALRRGPQMLKRLKKLEMKLESSSKENEK